MASGCAACNQACEAGRSSGDTSSRFQPITSTPWLAASRASTGARVPNASGVNGRTAAPTMTTTTWGVKLAHAMDPKPLKRAFGLFLTIVALNMLRKAAGW